MKRYTIQKPVVALIIGIVIIITSSQKALPEESTDWQQQLQLLQRRFAHKKKTFEQAQVQQAQAFFELADYTNATKILQKVLAVVTFPLKMGV